jgi:hypothetical protein
MPDQTVGMPEIYSLGAPTGRLVPVCVLIFLFLISPFRSQGGFNEYEADLLPYKVATGLMRGASNVSFEGAASMVDLTTGVMRVASMGAINVGKVPQEWRHPVSSEGGDKIDRASEAMGGATYVPFSAYHGFVGSFAGSVSSAAKAQRLAANKGAGDAFRDEVAAFLRTNRANDLVQTEYPIKTILGWRRYDIAVFRGDLSKPMGLVETKLGRGWYNPTQRAKDWLMRRFEHIPVDVVYRRK